MTQDLILIKKTLLLFTSDPQGSVDYYKPYSLFYGLCFHSGHIPSVTENKLTREIKKAFPHVRIGRKDGFRQYIGIRLK